VSFVAGVIMGFLVVLAALRVRRTLSQLRGRDTLSDDMVRRIETEGQLEVAEPLDRREIAEEEERFWEETWDEPEEY
jgi:hypothetical protein